MSANPNPSGPQPPRPELRKYQAGVFLIILSLGIAALGLIFDQSSFYIVSAFLLITGVVFQFDKDRPKGRIW
jgi:hypothetical protein